MGKRSNRYSRSRGRKRDIHNAVDQRNTGKLDVIITNGQRDNWKTTTLMQTRTITNVLQGRRCPTEHEVIKNLEKRRKQQWQEKKWK